MDSNCSLIGGGIGRNTERHELLALLRHWSQITEQRFSMYPTYVDDVDEACGRLTQILALLSENVREMAAEREKAN